MNKRHLLKPAAALTLAALALFGGLTAYAASKGAVDAFVMNAAKDLGPQGIRVCGLRPGMTIGLQAGSAPPVSSRPLSVPPSLTL